MSKRDRGKRVVSAGVPASQRTPASRGSQATSSAEDFRQPAQTRTKGLFIGIFGGLALLIALAAVVVTAPNRSPAEQASPGASVASPAANKEEDEQDSEPDEVEAPEPLSYEDLANATLAVPPPLIGFVIDTEDNTIDLVDGHWDAPEAPSSIDLITTTPMIVDGEAFTVAMFQGKRGNGYSTSDWAIYDTNADLVAYQTYDDWNDLGAAAGSRMPTDLDVADNKFSYVSDAVALLGDGTSPKSKWHEATVTWQFDGKTAQVDDVVYHLPSGDARAPDQALLQSIYDDLSEGRIAERSDALDSEVERHLGRTVDLVGDLFYSPDQVATREMPQYAYTLPSGAKVEQCVLIPAIEDGYGVSDAMGVEFPLSDRAWNNLLSPGQWACGISWDRHPISDSPSPNQGAYQEYLIVRSDEKGNPKIEYLGTFIR